MGDRAFYKDAHHNMFYLTCCSCKVMLTFFPLCDKGHVPSPWTWVNEYMWLPQSSEYNESEAMWILQLYTKKAMHFHLVLLGCLLLNLSHNAGMKSSNHIKRPWGELWLIATAEVPAKSQHQLVGHVSESLWKGSLQSWLMHITLLRYRFMSWINDCCLSH